MGKFYYQHRTITLQNNDRVAVYTHARYFRLLENSGSDIKIQINDEPESVIKRGMSINLEELSEVIGEPIKNLTLLNDTGAAVTIEYTLSNAFVTDDRVNVSGAIDVNASGDTVESPAAFAVDATAQVAVAADSTVREVLLQNNGANAVWIGDSNVAPATSRGHKIDPGASATISCSGDIYARCAAGLTSTLSIFKVKTT